MKQTKTGAKSRSLRAGANLVLIAGASVLLAVACGGGDEGGDGDGGGTGSNPGTGGIVNGGTGGAGTGGVVGGTGGVVGGTGGATTVAPTMPGTAPATPITAGDFTVDATGFGSDAVSGFQGFAYTYIDMGGSVIYPADFSALSETEVAEGKICANGTGAQVVDMMYSVIWGGGVGWNLNQAADGDPAPADVSAFDGVTFTLEAAVTAEMRFVANVGTSSYCVAISAGENVISWTDLNSTCWEPTTDGYLDPATQQVDSVAWQVVTNTGAAVPFDFCVGGLSFNAGGGMGGAPAN